MELVIPKVLELLDRARFEYPVAIHPGRDPELGPVLEVDAFDVVAVVAVAVSSRLAAIVWPVAFESLTLLPGIVHDFEAEAARDALPAETVWYTPRSRSHARA